MNLKTLHAQLNTLIESPIASPPTLIWILFTDGSSSHKFSHCIRAAIWTVIPGRQVEPGHDDMNMLFKKTLLCDIDLNLLPERLITERVRFHGKEYLAYRKHVDPDIDLLSQYADPNEKVMRILRYHHERHDGLGFPRAVKSNQIPMLARFATVAYCFERLLRNNCGHGRVLPARAIACLCKQHS